MSEAGHDGWSVVVPVKPSAIGKSRLVGTGIDRVALARAIALDTIDAVRASAAVARVVVVTDDADVAAALPTGVEVTGDGDAAGLNAAISRGIEACPNGPRAALLGDLPALRPADLTDALRLAARHGRSVVADAEGTGTTLLTAGTGIPWTCAFGPDSFVAHLAVGAAPLEVAATSTLRRDVDTAGDLAAARDLGLGARTAALVTAATAGAGHRHRAP